MFTVQSLEPFIFKDISEISFLIEGHEVMLIRTFRFKARIFKVILQIGLQILDLIFSSIFSWLRIILLRWSAPSVHSVCMSTRPHKIIAEIKIASLFSPPEVLKIPDPWWREVVNGTWTHIFVANGCRIWGHPDPLNQGRRATSVTFGYLKRRKQMKISKLYVDTFIFNDLKNSERWKPDSKIYASWQRIDLQV